MREVNNVLEQELKKISKFVDDEGVLLKSAIQTAALNMDGELIKTLLGNEFLKKAFFVEADNTLVFDKIKFSWVINDSEFLPNSYTSFKNKIGLGDSSQNFIKHSDDVVLNFPFKDCHMFGGQEKEKEKRTEVLLNDILCKNEIDCLLDKKVFTNTYRYSKKGTEKGNIKFDDDNLLIKGNNLIVLHSLLPKFEGKIPLIFIDPPYNTGSDTFGYNDKFNHSTWLTFMKNRLEVAKRLLTSNGSIYISIDYNEVHYLKILMDEVFGRQCFQREIIWRIGWLSGYKTTAKNYIRNHDTILFYTKDPNNFIFNKSYLERDKDYQERFNDAALKEIKKFINDNFTLIPAGFHDEFTKLITTVGLPEQYPYEDTWNCSIYDKLNSIAVVSFSGEKVSKMLGVDEIKGQKAEKLIQRIIETSSNPGDYVLDFFAGSGTTYAVALKTGRKFIGVEQMDYIEDTTAERIKKVIRGEDNSGITQDTGWLGGGSFVYTELMKDNQKYIDKINSVDEENISSLYDEILESPFVINYKIDSELLSDPLNKEAFDKLPFEDKKQVLIDLIEKNQLYVNYSDVDDESLNISEEDKVFSKSMYEGE
jgi:adenine-specific DNA-methyltransferase